MWAAIGSAGAATRAAQFVPLSSTSSPIPDDMDEEKPPATVKAQRQRTAVKRVGKIRVKQCLATFCHVQRSCDRVHTADTGAVHIVNQTGQPRMSTGKKMQGVKESCLNILREVYIYRGPGAEQYIQVELRRIACCW